MGAIKPQVKVELLEMGDPTFEVGVVKTARARLTNPTAKQFTYTTKMYLCPNDVGTIETVTTTIGTIIIAAGGFVDVDYTINMPLTEGEYYVFIPVWYGTDLLVLKRGTETVVIEISPAIQVGPITWE